MATDSFRFAVGILSAEFVRLDEESEAAVAAVAERRVA